MRIRITSPSSGEVFAEFTGESPETARAIWDALPLEARASTWGDEIYFSIPVDVDAEEPREVVEMGDLG